MADEQNMAGGEYSEPFIPQDDNDVLAEATNEISAAAMSMAKRGINDMMDGVESMAMARDFHTAAKGEAMLGASDLTRAVDASIVADRLATLSDIVGAAGVNDIAQGAELIAASHDVEAISAAVGLMTVDDLDKGLELGRLSGELQILSKIVGELQMPVLSAILGDRGERLSDIAVDTILRAAATRSLTELIEATGQRIGDLGANEVDEGVMRIAASDIAANRSADLEAAGLALGARGMASMAAAAENAEIASSLQEAAMGEIAEGASALGAASVLDDAAAFEDEARDI